MTNESFCDAHSTASSLDMSDGTWHEDEVMLLDEVDLDDSFLEDCFISFKHVNAQQEESRDPLISSDASPMAVESAQSVGSTESIELASTHSDVEQQCDSPKKISGSDKNFSEEYSRALNNLASSMRRSEFSRAQILRQGKQDQSPSWMNTHGQQMSQIQQRSHPCPQTVLGLSGLLSGRSSTLTLGLEQSRRQLKSYMESVHRHSL
mmetsp:Transcript_27709/g.31994  ORF Transcript_27709/g.31994 Transcript_27709/m.31994 type:complete len:207 (-) Transcript_27709:485-1105(-)